jgi:protein-tyrosine-phosphatase
VKKILFVCIENSNRSQMAQAFATIHGKGRVQAFSAGSKPSGVINPKAITAMGELHYDLSAHASKSLDEVKSEAPFDVVVTMGCGDACPWMPAKQYQSTPGLNYPAGTYNVNVIYTATQL